MVYWYIYGEQCLKVTEITTYQDVQLPTLWLWWSKLGSTNAKSSGISIQSEVMKKKIYHSCEGSMLNIC